MYVVGIVVLWRLFYFAWNEFNISNQNLSIERNFCQMRWRVMPTLQIECWKIQRHNFLAIFFNVIVFVFSTEFQEANLFWRNSVPKAHIPNWMYTHTSARLCKLWIIYTINSEFKMFKNSAFMEGFFFWIMHPTS